MSQIAATGTFDNAFYNSAETQLDELLKLIEEVDDNQLLAKLALYAREKAFMKAIPDLLSDAAKGPTVWAAMVRDESTDVEDEFEYSASTWGFQ